VYGGYSAAPSVCNIVTAFIANRSHTVTRGLPSWRAYLPHGPSPSALDNVFAVPSVLSAVFRCVVVLCDNSFVLWHRIHTLVIEGACLHRLGRS
jgi:hypothetical protein